MHPASPGVPTPRPMTTAAGGDAAVSVTSTRPLFVTVKLLDALPRTATVPLNVSVVCVGDGVIVVVVVEEFLWHAAAVRASASTIGTIEMIRFMRATSERR